MVAWKRRRTRAGYRGQKGGVCRSWEVERGYGRKRGHVLVVGKGGGSHARTSTRLGAVVPGFCHVGMDVDAI